MRWVSVKERTPRDDISEQFVVWYGYWGVARWWFDKWFAGETRVSPSHWLEITPPEK